MEAKQLVVPPLFGRDRFSAKLWGKVDLNPTLQRRHKTLAKISSFLKDKAYLEKDYGQKLTRLVRNAKFTQFETKSGPLDDLFNGICNLVNGIAKHHKDASEELFKAQRVLDIHRSKLLTSFNSILKEWTVSKRAYDKIEAKLRSSETSRDNMWKGHVAAKKAAEEEKKKLEEDETMSPSQESRTSRTSSQGETDRKIKGSSKSAGSTIGSWFMERTPKLLEKIPKDPKISKQKYEESENNYMNAVKACRKARLDFDRLTVKAFDTYQTIEQKRICSIWSGIQDIVGSHRVMVERQRAHIFSFVPTMANFDVNDELRFFMNKHRTYLTPQPLPIYIPIMTDGIHKDRSLLSPKAEEWVEIENKGFHGPAITEKKENDVLLDEQKDIENFFEKIFETITSENGRELKAEEKKKIRLSFENLQGRKSFSRVLNRRRGSHDNCYTKGAMIRLSEIVLMCLDESKIQMTSSAAQILLVLSQTFFFKRGSEDKEVLKDLESTKAHKKDIKPIEEKNDIRTPNKKISKRDVRVLFHLTGECSGGSTNFIEMKRPFYKGHADFSKYCSWFEAKKDNGKITAHPLTFKSWNKKIDERVFAQGVLKIETDKKFVRSGESPATTVELKDKDASKLGQEWIDACLDSWADEKNAKPVEREKDTRAPNTKVSKRQVRVLFHLTGECSEYTTNFIEMKRPFYKGHENFSKYCSWFEAKKENGKIVAHPLTFKSWNKEIDERVFAQGILKIETDKKFVRAGEPQVETVELQEADTKLGQEWIDACLDCWDIERDTMPTKEENKLNSADKKISRVYLQSLICVHPIWKETRFWENAIHEALAKELKRCPKAQLTHRWCADEEQEEALSLQRKILFGILASFQHNMSEFGLDPGQTIRIVQSVCAVYGMASAETETLLLLAGSGVQS